MTQLELLLFFESLQVQLVFLMALEMKSLDGAILRGQTILRISTLSHDQKWEAGDKKFPIIGIT